MAAVGAFVTGIGLGLTGGVLGGSVGFASASALGLGTIVGSFLATQGVTLALTAASIAATALSANRAMENSGVNVRIPTQYRWHAAGLEEVGGTVGFAAFDADGNFWYRIIHCDSELMELVSVKFDDVVLTIDVDHRVTNDEFQSETDGLLGLGLGGGKQPFFSVWTATFSPADPVPAPPPEFLAAFPEWTSDHKNAGSTVTTVKIDAVDKKSDPQVYRWRGAIGIGEPSVSIIGIWSRIPDPRDLTQDMEDPSTWKKSTNLALISTWNRMRRQGFNRPAALINWDEIADAADICDEDVLDKYAVTAPRYSGGVLFTEDREPGDCERDIYAGMDGRSHFDSEGKWYCRPGAWYEPAVSYSMSRDILAMADGEAGDGETPLDGVIVYYKEPALGMQRQSVIWKNLDYYDEAREPHFAELEASACKWSNQAQRLAKQYGRLTQATRRLGPTMGKRGRQAKREGIVSLPDYEPSLSVAWRVATAVEYDASGLAYSFGLVPCAEEDFDLDIGEEVDRPAGEKAGQSASPEPVPLLDPEDVLLEAETVPGSGGNVVRLRATFPAPPSITYRYEFIYSLDGGTTWGAFDVDMGTRIALSPIVAAGAAALVSWRTVSTGGTTSDWLDPAVTINAVSPPTADSTIPHADSSLFKADMA